MEVCRLCLDLLQGNEFIKLDSSYKCVIINVIPEVDLEISPDPVICKQCSKSIDEIGKFKKKCHESEAQLKQKCHGRISQNLTVKQILHGSNSDEVIISEKAKERICRTCLESIEFESFTILTPSSSDAYLESMLTMCLSDVDLQISRDPVMCEKCFSCLQQYHQLKTAYLEVEEKLRKYKSVNHMNSALLNLHNVLEMLQTDQKDKHNLTTVVDIKSENGNNKTDVINKTTDGEFETDLNQLLNEDNSRLLAEEINIKMEEDFPFELYGETSKDVPNKLDDIMKEVLKNHKQEIHYSCSNCAFTMANKRHYVMHMLTTHTTFNDEERLMHFCHLCKFKTMYKAQMKKHIEHFHMVKEKLNCPFCSFTSLYALNLRRHIAIHEDMQNLYCSHPLCDFKTSYKYSLQRHEIKMHQHQCPACNFKNRNHSTIQKHLRTEHGIFEILTCEKCRFQAFNLMTLRRHIIKKHKGGVKTNFTSTRKTKDELTAEEEEEIKNLFKDYSG